MDKVVKIVIIGNSCVGKSCFLLNYIDGDFSHSFISTIGIDFKIKTVMRNGINYRLQIWDTAGQERFNTITKSYYRGSMAAIVMYSVTDLNSYKSLSDWIDTFKRMVQSDKIPIAIVANKVDLHSLTPSIECVQKEFPDERVFTVSVKDSVGIDDVMEYLISRLEFFEHDPLITTRETKKCSC